MPIAFNFVTRPFQEAIEWLRKRINLPTDRWDDVRSAERDAVFTVAGAKGNLLGELRQAVDKAIEQGQTVEQFAATFDRLAEGWIAPEQRNWRSRLIYLTNLRSAWAAGRFAYQLDPEVKKIQPYLQFVHSDALVPRPHHKILDGEVFPADEIPFGLPNGYNCLCRYVSLSDRVLRREGLTVSAIRRGDTIDGIKIEPDPGWETIPGQTTDRQRQEVLQGIIDRVPEPIARYVQEEIDRLEGSDG